MKIIGIIKKGASGKKLAKLSVFSICIDTNSSQGYQMNNLEYK